MIDRKNVFVRPIRNSKNMKTLGKLLQAKQMITQLVFN